MSASASIPLEGVLNCWNDAHDLPDLLLSVSRSSKTGRLLFSNPEADRTLYVKEGKIIFAESSSEDDGIGQYLLRRGQISLIDYVRLSSRVEPDKRLEALLVEEGVLEPRELVRALTGQVRAIILGLFRRTETWYQFRSSKLPERHTVALDMPTSRLILDGVQNVDSWRRVSKGVGSLRSVYRRIEECAAEWSRLDLSTGISELLDMLKEPVSVDHICTHASLPDFDACRNLWAFRCLGWVESHEAAERTLVTESARVVKGGEEPAAPEPEAAAEAAPAPKDAKVAPPIAKEKPAPPRIPESLIATRISGSAEEQAKAPRANVDALAQTQFAMDPNEVTKRPPEAPTPRTVPEELHHTRIFAEPPPSPSPAESPDPSTEEMMEAILEGDAPAPSRPVPAPSAETTQFFDAGPPVPDEPEEPGEPFTFDELDLDDDAPTQADIQTLPTVEARVLEEEPRGKANRATPSPEDADADESEVEPDDLSHLLSSDG